MKIHLPRLWFCLGIAIAAATCAAAAAPASRPNVLFIICDDLNTALPRHGRTPFAATPNLERLMAQGITFQNAQSNAPICIPSRNALLTGISPVRSGHYRLGEDWRQNPVLREAVMLPRHFKENGYRVFGTGKVHHNGMVDAAWWTRYGEPVDYGPFPWDGVTRDRSPRADQVGWLENDFVRRYVRDNPHDTIFVRDGQLRFGWESSFGPLSEIPEWHPDPARGLPGYRGWVDGENKPFRYVNDRDRDRMPDEKSADFAIDVLRERHDAPFFLGVGFVRPHTPLYVPKEYFERFPLDSLELPPVLRGDLDDCAPAIRDHCLYGRARFEIVHQGGEQRWKRWLQAYLACVAFVDDQLGRILDALARSPYADNTIVVFTSDNGYHIGEKQYLFKASLWEESTRVPLVIRVPGLAAGQDCTTPVSLLDLYPTLNELCGLPQPAHPRRFDGNSLQPLLADPAGGRWDGPPVALSSSKELTGLHHTVRSATHRYTRAADGTEELYDHGVDRYEWHNLATTSAHADTKQTLRRQLELLLEQLQP